MSNQVSPRRSLTRALFKGNHALGIAGFCIVVLWALAAIFASVVSQFNPLSQVSSALQAPSVEHWFGTDVLGRDVFSRIIYGAQVSIPLALLLVLLALLIGAVLGAVAGYFGGRVDSVIMRLCDLVLSFPTVILAMVVVAALGPSLFNAVLAAVIVSWPSYARVMRSLVMTLRAQNYVVAGRLLGFSPVKSLLKDVAPSTAGSMIVLACLDVGTAVLLLSGLSFLGLGATPPTAEWGSMISDGMKNFDSWWISVFPGLAILSIVVAFNLIGDALRDILDPKAST